jgi:hypothetical protein
VKVLLSKKLVIDLQNKAPFSFSDGQIRLRKKDLIQEVEELYPDYKNKMNDQNIFSQLNLTNVSLEPAVKKRKCFSPIPQKIVIDEKPVGVAILEQHFTQDVKKIRAANNLDINSNLDYRTYWTNKVDKELLSVVGNYFSWPCTTIYAERVFSQTKDTHTDKRNNLKVETINDLISYKRNIEMIYSKH